jgi:hypothetical protein
MHLEYIVVHVAPSSGSVMSFINGISFPYMHRED